MFSNTEKYLSELISDISVIATQKIIITIVIIALLWFVRKIILRIVKKRSDNEHLIYSWNKYSYYIFFAVAAIIFIDLWFKGFSNVLTLLGLLAAGIAFALKDPVLNLFGWIYIFWRGPLKIGDRIEIGKFYGDVIDTTPFHFDLMEIGSWVDGDQYTGRILSVPNGKVFTEIKANYSKGHKGIWDEIDIVITFESNWEKAKKILLDLAKEYADHKDKEATYETYKSMRTYMIYNVDFEPKIFTNITSDGIRFTLRYFINIMSRRSSANKIKEKILEEFSKQDDIMFAHGTTRFFDNKQEGKPGSQDLMHPGNE